MIDRRSNDWRALSPLVLVALLLHGLVLMLAWPQRERFDRAAPALQWVRLLPPTAQTPPTESIADSEDAPPTDSAPPTAPSPAVDGNLAGPATPSSDLPQPAQRASEPSARRLREQVLIASRARAAPSTPEGPVLEGFAVPRLPGAAGWLNDQLGTVAPRHDSWLEADGANAARVVTGSGQVYCGRRRAPTAAEEFNPWMSAAIMSWRECGRRRPEPIDLENPWLRGPGHPRP